GNTTGVASAVFDFLDNLVGNNGTVTFDEDTPGEVAYEVTYTKPLSGTGTFQAGNSQFGLNGSASINTSVTLHLPFGLDQDGFFIDAAVPEELTIGGFNAAVNATGHFGPVEVTGTGNLNFDPDVRLSLNLTDPDNNGADGQKIRLTELINNFGSALVKLDLHNDPGDSTPDVAFDGSLALSGFNLGQFASVDFDLSWADVKKPGEVTVNVVPDFSKFTNITPATILAVLTEAINQLDRYLDIPLLDQPLPLVGKSIKQILSGAAKPLAVT